MRRSNIPILVCSFVAALSTGGTVSTSSLYLDAVQDSLGLSQEQVNTIEFNYLIAGLLSWGPGMVVDKYASKLAIMVGGITGAVTITIYWLIAIRFIPVAPALLVPVLSFLSFCDFCCYSFILGGSIKTLVKCVEPTDRGAVVGIAFAYVGLAPAVYGFIFQVIPTLSPISFFPLTALFYVFCVSLPTEILLPTRRDFQTQPIQYETTPLHFQVLYFFFLLVGLILGIDFIVLTARPPSDPASYEDKYWAAAIILVLWISPLLGMLYLPRRRPEEEGVDVINTIGGYRSVPSRFSLFQTHNAPGDFDRLHRALAPDYASIKDRETPHRLFNQEERRLLNSYQIDNVTQTVVSMGNESNFTLYDMLQEQSAWLLLWTTCVMVGSAMTFADNVNHMVDSLGFSDSVAVGTLGLFYVVGAASRVLTGTYSEPDMQVKLDFFGIFDQVIPRPIFLILANVLSLLANIFLAFSANLGFFIIGVILSGLSFGMIWPLLVLLVVDMYGTASLGAIFMFQQGVGSSLGTLFLSNLMAYNIYDHFADDDTLECTGVICFRATHLVIAALTVICIFTSFWLLPTANYADWRTSTILRQYGVSIATT